MTIVAAARSEWTKTRSLRSTVGALAAVFVVTVGLGALVCILVKDSEVTSPGFDPLELSFYGLAFSQVAAVCFGTLMMSQEYQRNALSVSLAAVPGRGRFYAGKVVVTASAALIVGLVSGFSAFSVSQALLGEQGLSMSDTGALRAVLGSGMYLALAALLALGLTAILRSGVVVLSLLIPLLLIVPFIFTDFASGVGSFLPNRAGQLLIQQRPGGSIGPWTELGVTALWACGALTAGWLAVSRRDA